MLACLDRLGGRLLEARPHEPMTREHGREDPSAEASPFAERVRLEITDPTRVDLQLRARLAISDRHGRRGAAEAKLRDGEPVQRRIRYLHAVTQQELAQLREF